MKMHLQFFRTDNLPNDLQPTTIRVKTLLVEVNVVVELGESQPWGCLGRMLKGSGLKSLCLYISIFQDRPDRGA